RLRHADRARRGLDARRLEGLHELPKAQSLDAAEQVLRLHLETVEGDLILLHAAIAEHLDLGTRHTPGRNRRCAVPARLFGSSMESPRWPGSFGLVRTSSVIRSARTGCVIHVLLPCTTYLSPSRAARVRSEARSDPVLGSVKTAVGRISPDAIFGNHCCFCSSVPELRMSSAAISERVPSEPTPI